MKRLVAKLALAAAIVVGPVAAIGAGTAGATPVYGGALAIAFPFFPNVHMVNMEVAPAFGPSNLVNNVYAESLRGCLGCNALAVSVQVDLVSFTTTPPNEADVAKVVDQGGTGDQSLAAAAMFVVTAPGRVTLSASGRAQLGSIGYQLRALSLMGSSAAAVQGNIDALLGQVIQILQSDVTTTSPPTSIRQGTPWAPISPTTSAVSTAVTGGVQITSNIQFDS